MLFCFLFLFYSAGNKENISIFILKSLMVRKVFQISTISRLWHFLLVFNQNCGLYPQQKIEDSILIKSGFLTGVPHQLLPEARTIFKNGKYIDTSFKLTLASLIRLFFPSLQLCDQNQCHLKVTDTLQVHQLSDIMYRKETN
jgi:hypothetical protein